MLDRDDEHIRYKVRHMFLGGLIEEMSSQVFERQSKLGRARIDAEANKQAYEYREKRAKEIHAEYEPILKELRDRINRYHRSI